jgi:YegS/Rv2252/BmrU family lipid kinase
MKTAAIINPSSGGGRMGILWNKHREKIQDKMKGVEIFLTKNSGDATAFAKSVAESGYDRLLIGGGDGTIHEVVNGLFDDKSVQIQPGLKIGILNGGRGCDFIKTLDVPTDLNEAVDIALKDKVKKVDVGQVKLQTAHEIKTIFYINSSSIGLGSQTAEKMLKSGKFLPPSLSYLAAGLKEFVRYRPREMKLSIDGREVFSGLAENIFVCNGKYSGGGMLWGKDALLDDGEFDVLLVKPLGKVKGLLSLKKVFDGTFTEMKEVFSYKASSAKIQTKIEIPIEFDGEVYRTSEAQYTCLPQALSFFTT